MEDINVQMILFLLAAGFLSAFVDSMVGGGGLISLPAMLMTGLPMTVALGTNKLASTTGSLTSTISFIFSGKVNKRLVAWLFPITFIGAALGAYTVKQIPSEFLKPLVIVLLIVVAAYTIFKKEWGQTSTYSGMTRKMGMLSALSAFGLGFYDGFFGPGTGSFLLFAFLLIGFDFVVASGNAKVLNFASNIASLLTFIMLDSVNYQYGLIAAVGMIAGALAGSQMAIRKGAACVRPLFITITVCLIGKQIWDFFK
jgi:uncharacterized membrane protein YfcA